MSSNDVLPMTTGAVHETAKNLARQELDAMMEELLARYQKAINSWLVQFRCTVFNKAARIYVRGSTMPRTEYAINLRGRVIPQVGRA